MTAGIALTVDGRAVEVPDDGASLLEVLRDRLHLRSAKDGCSPQGQCGCCTVLVDGSARVACVTPARRVAGRTITTLEGLPEAERAAWAEAFAATGASQCGFCTPGIIVRLAALAAGGGRLDDEGAVGRALAAHLCRCTGWRTIFEAAARYGAGAPGTAGGLGGRDAAAAARRASIEGGVPQAVGPGVALGRAGFADDTAPLGSLIATRRADGAWSVAPTAVEADAAARRIQGRRSTIGLRWPIDVPPGDWAFSLRTTWVEPAYLEPDASWAEPGGPAASPLANGGAFGGKEPSGAPAVAELLAAEHAVPVRVRYAREDVVRLGPKRPPLAAGIRADGTGVVRVARTEGIAVAIHRVAPGLAVEEIDVAGPPTSARLRAAGWAEAAVLLAALRGDPSVTSPAGASARASIDEDGTVHVWVSCGEPLDEVVLRSYCIGAAHQALGWVRSEGIAVDEAGAVHDLTLRSFGILRATEMPTVTVEIDGSTGGPPVNGSDAVFAAVAAADWIRQGCPRDWPTRRGGRA